MAALKAMHGKIPYYQFGYTQTPALPYLNGILMKITGFGFLEQRFVNMFWELGALIILMVITIKTKNYYAQFASAWILISSQFWVMASCNSTYGAVNFFLILASLVFFMPWRYRTKVILFSIAGSLAIGCRLTVLPVIMIFHGYLILQGDTSKQKWYAFLGLYIALSAVFLPFFIISPKNFIFWNLIYHLKSKLHYRFFVDHLAIVPGATLFMACALIYQIRNFKSTWRSPETIVLFAAIIGILFHMVLKVSYAIYSQPFFILGSLGACLILSKSRYLKILTVAAILLPLIYLTPFSPMEYKTIKQINNQFKDKNWLSSLNQASDFIQKVVPPNGRILTPFPMIAIEANRNIFDGMEMGKFGITDEIKATQAQKLNLMPYTTLCRIVKNKQASAIVLYSSPTPWNFHWSVPSFMDARKSSVHPLYKLLNQNYQLVFSKKPIMILIPR